MEFFGVGLPELVVILVLTLIVVGPQRLPEVAAQMARAIKEFRRYTSGMSKELLDAVQELEREFKDLRGELDSVSAEVRQKAEAFGRDLTETSDTIREKLQLEEPKPQSAAGSAQPALTAGDNGANAKAKVAAAESPQGGAE